MHLPLKFNPKYTRYRKNRVRMIPWVYSYCTPVTHVLMYPIYYLRPYILPPSRNSDPVSHSRLFPPTHYGSCLAFVFRENLANKFFLKKLRN